MAVFQGRFYYGFVFVLWKGIELPLANAKAPGLAVVGGSIRDPIGMIGQRMQVFF